MKGIILAGGTGSRLYPITKVISKQLLPVYDKPMIYYPLSTLMLFDIKDILIISTPEDLPNIENLLGTGEQFGINLQYKVQNEPKGIAQALLIGEDFIANEKVCLILGDNIFYMGGKFKHFKAELAQSEDVDATIFTYHVSDPQRFGVVEFSDDEKVHSIEEKPINPKSSYVSVGLYFYPQNVVEKVKKLEFSVRGELEITDLHNIYLQESKLKAIKMGRGSAWLDAGTPDSLMEASSFVQIIEKRQGRKIACIEEIALHQNFITIEKFQENILSIKNCDYRTYLLSVLKEYK